MSNTKSDDSDQFSEWAKARDMMTFLRYVQAQIKAFIVSTSYEYYIKALIKK